MAVNKQIWGAAALVADDPTKIDKDFLRRLRQLCHPDKHANSELSKAVWEQLEKVRKALDTVPGK